MDPENVKPVTALEKQGAALATVVVKKKFPKTIMAIGGMMNSAAIHVLAVPVMVNVKWIAKNAMAQEIVTIVTVLEMSGKAATYPKTPKKFITHQLIAK